MNSMKPLLCDLLVGATIWRYNRNKRRYTEGSAANQVTERERFEPIQIEGETKVSWLVKNWNKTDKIPKDSSKWSDGFYACKGGQYSNYYALSEQAIDDHCWRKDNRHRIQSQVAGATIEQLKAIAEIIGFKE